jgi:hypothetical protein
MKRRCPCGKPLYYARLCAACQFRLWQLCVKGVLK